jgi:hypothetical protein
MTQDFWVAIEAVAVSLSFVVATFAYVADKRRQAAREESERLLCWQTGVIHKLFQRAGSNKLSFDQIADKYKIEATTVPEGMEGSTLTDEALRSVMFRFVKDRIVKQHGSDFYSLDIDIRDAILDMTKLAPAFANIGAIIESQSNVQKVVKCITGLLLDEPRKYDLNDVIVRIARQENLPNENVRDAINFMIADKRLYILNDGKLSLNTDTVP